MSAIGHLEHHLLLEQMRATVLDAVMRCGHTRLSVAEEAGVRPRRLSDFLRGADLGPVSTQKLDAWCARWGGMGAWPEQAALSLLVSDLPLSGRLEARAEFVRWYMETITRIGAPVPDWVKDELETLEFLTRKQRSRQGEKAE